MWKQTQINPKYEVSDDGQVRTISTGHIKSQKTDRYGYKVVCLSVDRNTRKYATVHRLVASAFIPNPNNYPQVNHKDEDKANNRVENLEWCDNLYNTRYGTGIERSARRKWKPVRVTYPCGKAVTYPSVIAAAAALKITDSSVIGAIKGKQKLRSGCTCAYERK